MTPLDPYRYEGPADDLIEPDETWLEWVAWRDAHRDEILRPNAHDTTEGPSGHPAAR